MVSDFELKLGAQCGITLAGIKAASLFTLKTCEAAAVRGYQRHFAGRGVYFEKLKESCGRTMLYVYNKKLLEGILFDDGNRGFLSREGYEYASCTDAIALLKERMQGDSFPHEVGLFLGYPLEDVEGFINDPAEGVSLCGYWKVYSGAEEKAAKFKRFDCCSRCILNKLHGGKPLCEIFK